MRAKAQHKKPRLDESLARVAAGGIPLRAEERLAEEKGAHARLFTSDLSVSEFLLARRAGCEPIAQVMGSSVFHVGRISDYRGKTEEVTSISEAHRSSRRAALDRLQQEAALVDADAVVGVHIRDRMILMGSRGKGGDAGGEVLEFTVIGTAVKAPWIEHPPGKPVLTDLSGQDLWALHQEGFQPCGFLFEFCRYHVWHVLNPLDLDPEFANRLQREGGATGELRISLLWNNTNDLDLHVISPSGNEISFQNKKSACGGELDVDMNVRATSDRPIENVYWAHGSAPRGRYQVLVKQFTVRDDNVRTPFRIEVVAGGNVTHYDATVDGQGTLQTACTFDYAGLVSMEIPHAKMAITKARKIAADKLVRQASAVGAEYVIGSDLDLEIHEVPCGFAGCELNDLDVEVSWFGTGVKRVPGPQGREKGMPSLVLSMMPLSRRRDSVNVGEEALDDIEVAAEEAEELAAENDETATFAAEVAVELAELRRARGRRLNVRARHRLRHWAAGLRYLSFAFAQPGRRHERLLRRASEGRRRERHSPEGRHPAKCARDGKPRLLRAQGGDDRGGAPWAGPLPMGRRDLRPCEPAKIGPSRRDTRTARRSQFTGEHRGLRPRRRALCGWVFLIELSSSCELRSARR